MIRLPALSVNTFITEVGMTTERVQLECGKGAARGQTGCKNTGARPVLGISI